MTDWKKKLVAAQARIARATQDAEEAEAQLAKEAEAKAVRWVAKENIWVDPSFLVNLVGPATESDIINHLQMELDSPDICEGDIGVQDGSLIFFENTEVYVPISSNLCRPA